MPDHPDSKMLDLMAMLAHELQSPVATIHTTADTLHGGYFGALTPEQKAGVETILRNCAYLEDMVCCYIDLSRIETGALEFLPRPVDLIEHVVNPVLAEPEYRENLKKMPVVCRFSPVQLVSGDARLLRIVLNNLLNNAVKYGRAGSTIEVSVASDGEAVAVAVRNEGVGISPEDIERRLFRPFQRLRQPGTEGVKGSGLGLHICRRIVEMHGGAIEARCDADVFVEFRFTLKHA